MTRQGLDQIPVTVEQTASDNKCGRCTNSKCCTYVTQQVDTPRSMADFDHLLWQVSHERVNVYKDEEGWFLLIENPCQHLGPGGMCRIYHERPQVCRDYSNDYCEFDSPAEEGFELYFRDYPSLLAYCRQRFKHWGKHRR